MPIKIQQIVRVAVCVIVFAWSCFSQSDPVPAAIANLSSDDYDDRQRAVLLLAQRANDPRTIEPLIGALTDSSDWIRQLALGAISTSKEARAVPLLIDALSDKSPQVRQVAARGLGQIGDPVALEPLLEALKSENEYVRLAVMEALSKFDDPRVVRAIFYAPGDFGDSRAKAIGPGGVEAMIDIARNGSREERSKALFVLSYYPDERALDVMMSAVRSNDDHLAHPAMAAIRRIGGNAVSSLRDAFVFPDTDWQMSRNIILLLAQIDDRRAEDALVELASSPDQRQRSFIISTLSELASGARTETLASVMFVAARDKNLETRILAIRALANLNREDVRPVFIDALNVPETRIEAAVALGNRGDESVLPILLDMLTMDDRFAPWRASYVLVRLGPSAVEGLIDVLKDTNKEFPQREIRRREEESGRILFCDTGESDHTADPRYLAALALGMIGDPRARPALLRATKDKAEWLRQAAVLALQRIEIKTRGESAQ